MMKLNPVFRGPTTTLTFLCSSLFLNGTARAAGNSLEEEMFGSDSKSSAPATGGSAPASVPTSVNAPLESPKSTATGEPLTLGGRLELQSIWNKNSNQNIGDALFANSTTAELYLDSRPTNELRGFVKGSISNRGNAQTAPTLTLYETWIKWSGAGNVFTTLGRQKLKWGAATFWNPTDFFAVQPKDPFAAFDVRPGANLLKVHVPFEKSGNNLYALASFENSTKAHDPKLAARAEFNYGIGSFTGELTATAAGGRRQPRQWGLDLSTALGPIDLIVESAWTQKSNRDFYRRSLRDDGTTDIVTFSRDNQTIAQVVAGLRYDLKYSESDAANLSLEYFWNDFGSHDPLIEAVSFLRGQSQRLYLANRYLAANIFLAQPGSLNDSSVLISGLWNMADKSWLARTAWTEKLNNKSSLILALSRSGGLGEFTGGIPSSLAAQVRSSSQAGNVNSVLNQLEGFEQEWSLSATAGIEL